MPPPHSMHIVAHPPRCLSQCRPGSSIRELHALSTHLLSQGLHRLGVLGKDCSLSEIADTRLGGGGLHPPPQPGAAKSGGAGQGLQPLGNSRHTVGGVGGRVLHPLTTLVIFFSNKRHSAIFYFISSFPFLLCLLLGA